MRNIKHHLVLGAAMITLIAPTTAHALPAVDATESIVGGGDKHQELVTYITSRFVDNEDHPLNPARLFGEKATWSSNATIVTQTIKGLKTGHLKNYAIWTKSARPEFTQTFTKEFDYVSNGEFDQDIKQSFVPYDNDRYAFYPFSQFENFMDFYEKEIHPIINDEAARIRYFGSHWDEVSKLLAPEDFNLLRHYPINVAHAYSVKNMRAEQDPDEGQVPTILIEGARLDENNDIGRANKHLIRDTLEALETDADELNRSIVERIAGKGSFGDPLVAREVLGENLFGSFYFPSTVDDMISAYDVPGGQQDLEAFMGKLTDDEKSNISQWCAAEKNYLTNIVPTFLGTTKFNRQFVEYELEIIAARKKFEWHTRSTNVFYLIKNACQFLERSNSVANDDKDSNEPAADSDTGTTPADNVDNTDKQQPEPETTTQDAPGDDKKQQENTVPPMTTSDKDKQETNRDPNATQPQDDSDKEQPANNDSPQSLSDTSPKQTEVITLANTESKQSAQDQKPTLANTGATNVAAAVSLSLSMALIFLYSRKAIATK